jgi:uncharacterized protein (UPF0333 family)
MERKGQAAMEFLMTYGWAILAAIIAIGVLAYFGVFSPGQYATGSAVVTAPFYVSAHNAKASAGVTLELQNNGGEDYTITSVVVTNAGTNATSLTSTAGSKTAIVIPWSANTTAITAGSSFKGDITVSYRKAGSTVDLTSTGNIAEKVTA